MVLYHGTTVPDAERIIDRGAELSFGKATTDFGQGFYATTNVRQARRRSEKVSAWRGAIGSVIQITLPREALARLDALAFVLGDPDATDFWSLVNFCRTGKPGHARGPASGTAYYDVVYGPVAKDYNRRTLHWNFDQVSFHTEISTRLLNGPGIRKMI
jgi:hypothetical protein